MKMAKKVLVLLLVLLVIAAAGAGGIYAYQNHQKESLQAEVTLVSNLNWGYWGDSMRSYGMVTDDHTQSVYIEDQTIEEVKVAEGDEVKIGDTLIAYSTAEIDLQIEMEQLSLQGIENNITLAQRELDRLKKITPVASITQNAPANQPAKQPQNLGTVMMKVPKKDGSAYNYIDASAKPYEGNGTPEEPYRFLCTQECYVLGSYLNRLVEKEQAASFEIWSGNSVTQGVLLSCWTFDGTKRDAAEAGSKWLVSTQEIMEDGVVLKKKQAEEETESEEPESPAGDVYTAEELKKKIEEQESELKTLEIEKQGAELDLKGLEKSREEACVLAEINGVVRSVGDPDNPPEDGSAFLEIGGGTGLYVKGTISELMLEQIKIGQEISVSSWNNGQTYSAVITEVEEYPSTNQWGYGEGNPNVSYYPFVAYIEETEGLSNGDDVEISIVPDGMQQDQESLYIDKAYVRKEEGRPYVMKAGEDNRLVKQYIRTGKTISGSAVEIKGGISETDRIAFPYGKAAKEGTKVKDLENN